MRCCSARHGDACGVLPNLALLLYSNGTATVHRPQEWERARLQDSEVLQRAQAEARYLADALERAAAEAEQKQAAWARREQVRWSSSV